MSIRKYLKSSNITRSPGERVKSKQIHQVNLIRNYLRKKGRSLGEQPLQVKHDRKEKVC